MLGCERGGGSDGDRSRTNPLPSGAVVIAEAPARRQVGVSARSPYQQTRPRQLSASERAAIFALAPNHTLHELAAEFGVSHETIRTVLRSSTHAE
jgi:hypothetical protein